MAERARLEELRVSAQELGAEARLRSGEVAEAVSELTALRVHNPLRERVHANLMRALCADGRTADALQVYRNTRTTLQTELGVEPSTELRQLQRSILRGALEDRPDAPRT
jgi:pentatricopeptide repeat protein